MFFVVLAYGVILLLIMTLSSLKSYKKLVSNHSVLSQLLLNPNCKVATGKSADNILEGISSKVEDDKVAKKVE